MKEIKCADKRKCFAREDGKCNILNSGYEAGYCPFCKAKRNVTAGVKYQDKSRY